MHLSVATHHHWPGSRYCLQAEATFRSCSARTFADNAVGTGHIGGIGLEVAGRGFISVGSSASLCALLHYLLWNYDGVFIDSQNSRAVAAFLASKLTNPKTAPPPYRAAKNPQDNPGLRLAFSLEQISVIACL